MTSSVLNIHTQSSGAPRKKIQKRSWTEEEDALLLKLVAEYGTVRYIIFDYTLFSLNILSIYSIL